MVSGRWRIYLIDHYDEKRKAKALDMALCLFEIKNNVWRQFKNQNYDPYPMLEAINECFEEHHIDIEDLLE